MTGAFATPGSREAALDSFNAAYWRELPPIIWVQPPSLADMTHFAEQTGLALNYLWLTASLFGHNVDFARAVVQAVPQGSDTSIAPSRWLTIIAESIVADVDNEELASASTGMLALYKCSVTGDAVTTQEWRESRNAFRRIDDEHARGVGNVLAAAAWDPVTIPAAVADVPSAWRDHVHRQVEMEIGWNEELAAQLNQWRSERHRHALKHAGPQGEADDWFESADCHAWRDRYRAGVDEYIAATPLPVPNRDELAQEAWNKQIEAAQATFLAVTKSLSPEDPRALVDVVSLSKG